MSDGRREGLYLQVADVLKLLMASDESKERPCRQIGCEPFHLFTHDLSSQG